MMYVKCYKKDVSGKGTGIFAGEFIPNGKVVWKLTDFKKLTKQEYNNSLDDIKKNAYPEGDHYVLATGEGESWNHSCDANTWWTADNELSARRDIQKDEEITYDYATTDIDPDIIYSWECKCGAVNCRKKLHWDDIIKPEVYDLYKGHLPSWVEDFVLVSRNKKNVYRYTTNGEGVWSAGKRLLPEELVEEANKNRAWLKKPQLPEGNFRFWLTAQGLKMYEQTLLNTHKKYLPEIKLEKKEKDEFSNIVYEDEHQVVEEVKND